MNRLEKDILDSEMGLYTRPVKNDDEPSEEIHELSEPEEPAYQPDPKDYTENGVQLMIDEALLGHSNEDDKFFIYGYQDELDISSLGHYEDEEPPKKEKPRDGTRLYKETVLLLETGEVDVDHGIALLKKNANDGHALSWVYLGQLYSNKTSVIYNPALAFECYGKAADMEFGEGYYNLGLCYAFGIGCEKDEEAAVGCFSEGASIYNSNCICALGMCYEFGKGCEINYEYAFTLYEKAYEFDHSDGANNLGGCYFYGHGVEQNKDKAIEIYKRAGELGNSNALCRLGIIYEEGDGVDADINTAFVYYKSAASLKNALGLYKLAKCYDFGAGTEQNFNKAFKCYSRSAALGYDPAKYEAGKKYISGQGTRKNYDAAYEHFISAAKNGFAPAEYEVANCFFDGKGAMKDRESAYMYYCYAYESDDINRANAAYKIGLCHLRGLGIEKDEGLAFDWFSISANSGNLDAMYMLGECYYFGVGTSVNEVSAVNCFLKAEKMINSSGEDTRKYVSLYLALGHCLEHGIGIESDPRRARQLYKTAAESGRPDALYEIGRVIRFGIGMKAEYAAARPYFLRSARKGYVPAILMMGVLSDEGRGVPKNKEDAQSWYLKAVNAGVEPHISAYDFPDRFAENVKLYTESRIKAQYRLGMLIASSDRTIQGYTESFELVSLAASMGYTPAQIEITRIYVSGGDLTVYYESPFFVPDSPIEGGDIPDKKILGDAMNKLGDTFFDGKNSLKKNEEAAARCYRYAAEMGNIESAYSYGWCLRHGVGVRENDAEAVKWLKMAADKGNANAAYSYGLCCEEGSSTGIKNKREALYYYRMAAGAGHFEAAQRFVKLSERDE